MMSNEQNEIREAISGTPGKNPAADGGDAALRTAESIKEIRSEALQSSPDSQLLTSSSSAEPSSADPFFSGRKHFPELDGLRGLAILMVLATHYAMAIPTNNAGERAIKNILTHGWAGVDLFFVLSGFLITGILTDSKGQNNYFRNFYGRRTLRIFPLYYGLLAVLLLGLIAFNIAGHWDHSLPHLKNLWHIQPWLWTYTFNIACAFGHGSAHLGQLWSLSVEEQFYLAWPLVIFLFPSRFLARICALLIALALVLRIALFYYAPHVDAYFLTPARMDSLAVGALIAVLARSRHSLNLRAYGNWAIAAAGLILAGRFALGLSRWITHSGTSAGAVTHLGAVWDQCLIFTVVAFFFGSLLIKTIAPKKGGSQGTLGKFFSIKPLRTAGKYSYGWYVFHYPIWILSLGIAASLPALNHARNTAAFASIVIAANFLVSFGAAFASFHLYEKHFLKLKKYFPERTINPPAKAPATELTNP